MSSSKRSASDADGPAKKQNAAAVAARRAWTDCMEQDARARAAIYAMGPSEDSAPVIRALAAMDELLQASMDYTLRQHSLEAQPAASAKLCECGFASFNGIAGARCRSCWIRPVEPPNACIQHQWCDLCECNAMLDEDRRMCELIRRECRGCTEDNPCDAHGDEWEECACEDSDPLTRPWSVLEAARARHAAGASDTRHPFEQALDPEGVK